MTAANTLLPDLLRAMDARPNGRPLLLGISGIDASGKSTLARTIADELGERGIPFASLSIDWFHTSAATRFLPSALACEPPESHGRHFFDHAFRWDELFGRLVDPLAATGACRAEVGVRDMRSDAVTPTLIVHHGVRVVLLEGIFIFRREYADRFHLRLWIDCPFELALQRAVERNQEGLSPEAIQSEYARVYFPAQRYHFERDEPLKRAHMVINAP